MCALLQKTPQTRTPCTSDSRRTPRAFPDHKDKDNITQLIIATSSNYTVDRRVAVRAMEIKVNHPSRSLDLYMVNLLGAVKVSSMG